MVRGRMFGLPSSEGELLSTILMLAAALTLPRASFAECLPANKKSIWRGEHCSTPQDLPSFHVVMVPSGHVIKENGSELTLTCNLPDHASFAQDILLQFAWEFKGTFKTSNESTRSIVVTEETEGRYRCGATASIVGGRKAMPPVTSISSSILVELPRIDGQRLDATTATPIHSLISKQVPQGGLAILDCQPHMNDPLPSSATVSWLRNKAPILGSDSNQRLLDKWALLVQNFSLFNEKVVEYECIVAGLRHFNRDYSRRFLLGLSENSTYTSSSQLPSDQIVVEGAKVTFTCFLNSISHATWWKDGTELDYQGLRFDGSAGPISEILVIDEVLVDDGGEYACVGGSGEQHNATLTVVAPPTGALILTNLTHLPPIANDVITNGSGVNLTCVADSLSGLTDITYQWYFGGVAITIAYPGLLADGNVLMVGGGRSGSVQCFATNRAGNTSATVMLLIKPRSPVKLHHGQKQYEDLKWGLTVYAPEDYRTEKTFKTDNISYDVRLTIHRGYEYHGRTYTCHNISWDINNFFGAMDIPVQEYAKNANGYTIKMEAALQYCGVMSDYVTLNENGICDVPIVIEVVSESFLDVKSLSHSPQNGTGSWNLKLDWDEPQSYRNGFLNDCSALLMCEGKTMSNEVCYLGRVSVNNLPNCLTCNWTVVYSNLDGNQLVDSIAFNTNALLLPPTLTSVGWLGSNGKTIQVSFLIPPQNCQAVAVTIYYSSDSTPINYYQTEVSLADDGRCKSSPSSSSSSSTYICEVELDDDALCWGIYNISVVQSNSVNIESPRSNSRTLPERPDGETGHCQVMPTGLECICCHKIDKIMSKMQEGENVVSCIIDYKGFGPVCLNTWFKQPISLIGSSMALVMFITFPYMTDRDLHLKNMSLSGRAHSSWLRLDYQFGPCLAGLLTTNQEYQAKICRGETEVVGSTCNYGNDTLCTELDAVGFINSSSLQSGTNYTFSAIVEHKELTVCAFSSLVLHTPEDAFTEPIPSTTNASSQNALGTAASRRNVTYIISAAVIMAVLLLLAVGVTFACTLRCILKRRKSTVYPYHFFPSEHECLDGAEDPINVEDIHFNRLETQTEATSVQNLQSGKAYILSQFLRSSELPDGSAQGPSWNEEEQRNRYHGGSELECNTITESGPGMEILQLEAKKDCSVQVSQKKLKKKSKKSKRTRKEGEGKQDEKPLTSRGHGLQADIKAAEDRERGGPSDSGREQRVPFSSLRSNKEARQALRVEPVVSDKTSARAGDGAELLHKETPRRNDSPASPSILASRSSLLSPSGYLPHSALPLYLTHPPHSHSSYLPELPLSADFSSKVHPSQFTPRPEYPLPPVTPHLTLPTPIPSAGHTLLPSSHTPLSTLPLYTSTFNDTSSGYVSNSMTTPTMGSDYSRQLETPSINYRHSFSRTFHPERIVPAFRQEKEDFLLSELAIQELDENRSISPSIRASVSLLPHRKGSASLNGDEEMEKEELESLSSTRGSVFFSVPTNTDDVGRHGQGMSLTPLLPSKGWPCTRMSEGYFSMAPTPQNDETLGFDFPSFGWDDCHETTPHAGHHGNDVDVSYLNIDHAAMQRVKFDF